MYGSERLTASGREDEIRRRHRDHFAALAESAREEWFGPQQPHAVAVIEADRLNLHQAMHWSFSTAGETAGGLAIATSIRHHWGIAGRLREGRYWLSRALALVEGLDADSAEAAWILAWLLLLEGSLDEARELLNRLESVDGSPHSAERAARVHLLRGVDALWAGEVDLAIGLFAPAVDHFVATSSVDGVVFGSLILLRALAETGDRGRFDEVARRAASFCRARGDFYGSSQFAWARAYLHWKQGDLGAALAAARESLDPRLPFDRLGHALKLDVLAWIAASGRNWERSARLLGAAQATWAEMGIEAETHSIHFAGHSRACAELLAETLRLNRLAELLAQGAEMTFEEALRYAAGDSDAVARGLHAELRLTVREQEIAAFLGKGLGSREIADRLSLSPRTVEGHISRAMAQLGMQSRAQLAAWAARR